MPSRLMPDDEVLEITEDVFSWMCSLAMEKCAKKSEKKKASCGGEAMRKRLLIKNFVAQMIDHERRSGTNDEHSSYSGEDEERMEVDVVDVDGDDGRLSMVISDRTSYESEADEEEEEEEYEEDGDGSEADEDDEVADGEAEGPDDSVDAENTRATVSYNCGLESSPFPSHGVPVPELHAQPPAYFTNGYCSPLQLYSEVEPSASRATLSPDWTSFHEHSSSLQTPENRYGGYNGEASSLLCPLEQSPSHFLYPVDVSLSRRPASPVPSKDSPPLGLELVFNEGEKGSLPLMTTPIPSQSDSTRAFASLSNVAFTSLPKIGSCRSEFASLHYHHQQSSKSITDLDTHITMLEEEDTVGGALSHRQIVVGESSHSLALGDASDISQRKRHFPPNFLTVGDGSDGALPLSPSFFGSKRVKL